MAPVILKNKTATGKSLQATFFPDKGMNLISYQEDGLEVIDQSTKALFEERYAGLGALIGPHFHHRKTETIPPIKDETLFPHIALLKAKGVQEPFSHGIARYAPWQTKTTDTQIKATLSGKDMWNGVPLSSLEGQNFKMTFDVQLTPEGLILDLSVVSDTASVVGIHYYYNLPNKRGTIISRVKRTIMDANTRKPIPESWSIDEEQKLRYPLSEAVDCTFSPFPDPLEGHIILDTETHQVHTTYQCICEENGWQLYHPADASYVCIEPVSAQDPRHPNLSVSSLRIHLQILTGKDKHEL